MSKKEQKLKKDLYKALTEYLYTVNHAYHDIPSSL